VFILKIIENCENTVRGKGRADNVMDVDACVIKVLMSLRMKYSGSSCLDNLSGVHIDVTNWRLFFVFL
jgi:hypothetical protein